MKRRQQQVVWNDLFRTDSSCQNDLACTNLGRGNSLSVEIGHASCFGVQSCEQIGSIKAVSIDIGDDSCWGEEACSLVGSNKASLVDIGSVDCDVCESSAPCEAI